VEGLCKMTDAQLLATEAVWRRLPEGRFEAQPLGPVPLRGRTDAPVIYRLA
jgi:class 3 adenylate cyclase